MFASEAQPEPGGTEPEGEGRGEVAERRHPFTGSTERDERDRDCREGRERAEQTGPQSGTQPTGCGVPDPAEEGGESERADGVDQEGGEGKPGIGMRNRGVQGKPERGAGRPADNDRDSIRPRAQRWGDNGSFFVAGAVRVAADLADGSALRSILRTGSPLRSWPGSGRCGRVNSAFDESSSHGTSATVTPGQSMSL